VLNDAAGAARMRLDSAGHAWLGGGLHGGLLVLFPKNADNITDTTKAAMILDGNGGIIRLNDSAGKAKIFLDGGSGDIVLENADCAEYFDIAEAEKVIPGTVMVIDEEGKLRQSSRRLMINELRVFLSGAGDFKPGITPDKKNTLNHRLPVALVGKVYCQADAWI